MRIHIVAVGTRVPTWVAEGFVEYARRLPKEFRLVLQIIPARRRGKGADLERVARAEGECLLGAVPRGAYVIALAPGGRELDTPGFAAAIQRQRDEGRDLALLIGGPEGLSGLCLQAADERWSLSRLTFAHPLVRVVLAEQVYRAWTLIAGRPYAR